MKKFAKKLIKITIVIILSPLIVLGLIFAGFDILLDRLKEPRRKKEYENSDYYKDFSAPYRKNILNEESYNFYNEAKNRNLPVNLKHSSKDDSDYLIVRDSIFLFPMNRDVFEGISYNTRDCKWEVSFDGEDLLLDDEWEKYKNTFTDIEQDLPCYLLIKKSFVNPCHNDNGEFRDNYALDFLPKYVRLVDNYTDIISE